MTLADIGNEIGLATSSVGDIANGRTESPRGDAAMRLYELHSERCKPTASEDAACA